MTCRHRFFQAIQAEGQRQQQTAVELLDDVVEELQSNQEFYGSFLTGDWMQQLRDYRIDKEFNSDIVDIVINALSNVTVTSCDVFTVASGLVRKQFTITPGRVHEEKTSNICLFFHCQHYEPLLDIKVS